LNTPVVLITGALTGIGRATGLAFAKEGARILVAGRRDEAGQNLVAELRRLNAEAEYVKNRCPPRRRCTNPGRSDRAALRSLGCGCKRRRHRRHAGSTDGAVPESYSATADTNVLGALLSMKHELRVMVSQGHGSIVNVSSTYGPFGRGGRVSLCGQ
jgi:NAD(P)-dependent dehydrogenase (short-subunit alcohol dehydrogenase family)